MKKIGKKFMASSQRPQNRDKMAICDRSEKTMKFFAKIFPLLQRTNPRKRPVANQLDGDKKTAMKLIKTVRMFGIVEAREKGDNL